jgi:hypothetical protein
VTTSLLQRTDVYQKIDPAFIASGVMTSDVSEVTLVPNALDAPRLVPDDVLERAADRVITEYVDSEKWCGDQRTKYAVLKVEVTSFVLAVICVALALVFASVLNGR